MSQSKCALRREAAPSGPFHATIEVWAVEEVGTKQPKQPRDPRCTLAGRTPACSRPQKSSSSGSSHAVFCATAAHSVNSASSSSMHVFNGCVVSRPFADRTSDTSACGRAFAAVPSGRSTLQPAFVVVTAPALAAGQGSGPPHRASASMSQQPGIPTR
eukprot:359747-Chlamydomonas_euryale.AAC.8